jgi:hypothetical protein
MAKLKIANSITDRLFSAAGKAKVVVAKSAGTARIENSKGGKISISVISGEMIEKEENIYEVAKIKVTSVDGKRSTIAQALSSGTTFDNHVTSITKMIDLNTEDEKNITHSTPTFSIDAKFNYISQDYDNLQATIPEHNLNSFLDECTKDEILNFKKRKNSRLSTFSRGNQMKNFVVPQGSTDKFSKSSPYYVRIGLNDGVAGDISQFLQKISIYDEVLNDYIQSNKKALNFNIQNGLFTTEDAKVMGYNISSFFDSETEIDLDNFFGLNQDAKASKMSYNLRKHLFKGYLKGVTKTGFRSFSELLNNVECHKEALCYSFEKFADVEVDSTRLQNIYAPAGSLSTAFIDTQVKYGNTYVYRIKAHYMIVGNSYTYRRVRYYEEDGMTYATAEVVNRPSIMVVPFDLFSVSKTIIQPPPVHPQVTFKTENNSNNEIQIYLSPTKNDIKGKFVAITEDDESQHELMKEFYSAKEGLFKFHTAVDSGLYEVFRLSQPPEEIAEFADAKLGEIRMPYRSTDAIFRDIVESNKEYYYMFRQVNEKGLVSNPTAVFKTRLVVDADDAKVITETYHFPKQIKQQPRREFKSMMQIRPAVEQVLFVEEQPALFAKTSLKGTLDDLQLGATDHAVWGRKFKLRVRSKTSGKIIDININFELAKNKTKEEF